ncbi:MAG: hypothetical protein ACTSRH_01320 [Promethearchaeota archaeon]
MSIHGDQHILPIFLTSADVPPIKDYDELALAFYVLFRELKKNEKPKSFSRLLWPFLCIQGVVSTHIILDGLKVFSKKGKLSNPPRQPLIGHVLRNIDNLSRIDQLNRILDIITYKDTEAEEIGESANAEYQPINIEALVNPDFLQTLIKLIPLAEYKSVSEYQPLDSNLTTEEALDISELYRETINQMKGNSFRWKSQIELIGEEVEKWLVDLKVQIKDIESLYSSQISKTSEAIDEEQIREKLAFEKDKIDQWKVAEKNKLIESILVLFKTAERNLEEIIKRNKFFTRIDFLKGRIFEELSSKFENHFEFLKEKGKSFLETLESLHEKYIEIKENAKEIDLEAERKISNIRSELEGKLIERNQFILQFEKEKQDKLKELEDLKKQIEKLFTEIKNMILKKHENCLREAKELISWSVSDDKAEIFSRPIQWVYMPLYGMIIENEELMEENIKLLFPGYVERENDGLYRELSEDLINLKEYLYEKMEEDMVLRSNFEFSCENKNLLEDKNLIKKLQQGISILRNKNLLNEKIEKEMREILNLILQ